MFLLWSNTSVHLRMTVVQHVLHTFARGFMLPRATWLQSIHPGCMLMWHAKRVSDGNGEIRKDAKTDREMEEQTATAHGERTISFSRAPLSLLNTVSPGVVWHRVITGTAWYRSLGIHSVISWCGSQDAIMKPDLHLRHCGDGLKDKLPASITCSAAAWKAASWNKWHYLLQSSIISCRFICVSVIFHLFEVSPFFVIIRQGWRCDG